MNTFFEGSTGNEVHVQVTKTVMPYDDLIGRLSTTRPLRAVHMAFLLLRIETGQPRDSGCDYL
jgi:hypothetical protein